MFCLFLNWQRADISPQFRPRKIPANVYCNYLYRFAEGIEISFYHSKQKSSALISVVEFWKPLSTSVDQDQAALYGAVYPLHTS